MPITPVILRCLKQHWSAEAPRHQDHTMLWAACCMGFFDFMRAGEFCITSTNQFDPSSSLCLEDIAIDSHQNPTSVRVTLKQSKTDPFCQGIYKRKTCPVAEILAYIAIRPPMGGSLFIYRDGTCLTRDKLVTHVQSAPHCRRHRHERILWS